MRPLTLEAALHLIRQRGTIGDLWELRTAFWVFADKVVAEGMVTGSAADALSLYKTTLEGLPGLPPGVGSRAAATAFPEFPVFTQALVGIRDIARGLGSSIVALEYSSGPQSPQMVIERLSEKLEPKPRKRALPIALGIGAAVIGIGVIGMLAITRYRKRGQLGDLLPGGKAEGHHWREFDPLQLYVGTLIELEHVRPTDFALAREIATDHLVENGEYYIDLCKMHYEPPCRFL